MIKLWPFHSLSSHLIELEVVDDWNKNCWSFLNHPLNQFSNKCKDWRCISCVQHYLIQQPLRVNLCVDMMNMPVVKAALFCAKIRAQRKRTDRDVATRYIVSEPLSVYPNLFSSDQSDMSLFSTRVSSCSSPCGRYVGCVVISSHDFWKLSRYLLIASLFLMRSWTKFKFVHLLPYRYLLYLYLKVHRSLQ